VEREEELPVRVTVVRVVGMREVERRVVREVEVRTVVERGVVVVVVRGVVVVRVVVVRVVVVREVVVREEVAVRGVEAVVVREVTDDGRDAWLATETSAGVDAVSELSSAESSSSSEASEAERPDAALDVLLLPDGAEVAWEELTLLLDMTGADCAARSRAERVTSRSAMACMAARLENENCEIRAR
jgi:hypothetical protein